MPKQQGVNGLDIKNQNRGLILRLLATKMAHSRTELTKITSLTKMTVSNIITEFLEDKVLKETEPAETTQTGRKPIVLEISEYAPKVLGIYLSRDALSGILATLDCKIIHEITIPLQTETNHTLTEKLFQLSDTLLKQANGRVLGIGVSSIGPLNARDGILLAPTNFFGIKNLNLKEALHTRYKIPVVVHNDMNASALAEKLFGSAQQYQNFIYLGLSNGIGAGIISDHQLYYNENGFSGEFGHTSIQYDGPVCECGRRGCLELYATMPVVCTQLQKIIKLQERPTPNRLAELYSLREGKEFLDSVAQKLTSGLTDLANLLSPQAIIIGHDGYFLPKKILQDMEAAINRDVLFTNYQELRILRSYFQNKAPLFGAACCVLDALFQGKIIIHSNI